VFTIVSLGGTRTRVERDIKEDAEEAWEDTKEYADDVWERLWGAPCVKDDQCTVVSYCHVEDDKFGMRPIRTFPFLLPFCFRRSDRRMSHDLVVPPHLGRHRGLHLERDNLLPLLSLLLPLQRLQEYLRLSLLLLQTRRVSTSEILLSD